MQAVCLPGMVTNIEIRIVDCLSTDSCSGVCALAPHRPARQLLCANCCAPIAVRQFCGKAAMGMQARMKSKSAKLGK